ncbi:hypothetical protein J2S06_000629 [Bacillus alveayuensis]|uniref:Uncharacterized protein n=1 Tax=Aeribacillus alveayuensis TaxID=279215 RepID=A0ABT9VKR1_9BACI|nr:hypothetical protein [Bacillus alveayuensis]
MKKRGTSFVGKSMMKYPIILDRDEIGDAK